MLYLHPLHEPSNRVAKFDKPAVKIMFQVTQIVRFLPERGLCFRKLDFKFCGLGHDFI